jgi:hypothetical protein
MSGLWAKRISVEPNSRLLISSLLTCLLIAGCSSEKKNFRIAVQVSIEKVRQIKDEPVTIYEFGNVEHKEWPIVFTMPVTSVKCQIVPVPDDLRPGLFLASCTNRERSTTTFDCHLNSGRSKAVFVSHSQSEQSEVPTAHLKIWCE